MKKQESKNSSKRKIIEKSKIIPKMPEEGPPTNVEKTEYIKSKNGKFIIEVVTPKRNADGYMICPDTWESWWE